jgi:hypothetical protein
MDSTPTPEWRTSTFSDGMNCVQIADLGDGRIGIRSSRNRDDHTRQEFAAFIEGVKAGEFDEFCA